MSSRRPDSSGRLDRDGVGLHWEVHGTGTPTILLAPTWSVIPSAHWKHQVRYLARHHRVVTFDGRGNGRSDRPAGAAHYTPEVFSADCRAVLDATGTRRAIVVALSCGALWSVRLAAECPERVLGLFLVGPAVGLAPAHAERERYPFDEPVDTSEGWAKYNAIHWRRDYVDFLRFFAGQMFPEPHSTKARDDYVGWACGTTPERLIDAHDGLGHYTTAQLRDDIAALRCPVRVVHGDTDRIRPHAQGEALADLTGGELITIGGGGHGPHLRDPVFVNRELEDFVDRLHPRPRRRTWVRAAQRPKRALYLSSSIGLGHALRDIAVASELRRLQPELQIDWLAQHPVTTVLERRGGRVHPASAWIANESAHFEDSAGEHDLHAFQTIREMDEILVNNSMIFHDVVTDEHSDLVIADEAWDVDYFLHENPELKHFEFAWMTDFVGWLPFPDGGPREAEVAADYNAEMIEQRARYRRVRDRSIFVGNSDDIVPGDFGPGLPGIREWTEANFEFAGYITGYDPTDVADKAALRDELGYHPDERVCIVTVGGSGVGADLLHRVAAAIPAARRAVDDLRVEVVCGPRIDRRRFPSATVSPTTRTCTICTAGWPPAIWPWCRAG